MQKILALEVDPDDVKLLAQVKDTALTVIRQQIRVDESRLKQRSGEQRLVAYEAAVERIDQRYEIADRQRREAKG